jgi:signal transduction histidine kinase
VTTAKKPSAPPAWPAGLVAVGLASLGLFGGALTLACRALRRERSALEREVQAEAEIQRSAQTKNALLGMVSHELRTPLQAIMAGADLLSQPYSQDELHAAVERMNRSLELLSGKLDTFSQYARLASGVEPVRRKRFLLADLLHRLRDDHAQEAGQRGQSIAIEMGQGTDLTLEGDPVRLRQIVDNYVTNAIKYSGPGIIRIGCSVLGNDAGDTAGLGSKFEIVVEDQGPGIAQAERLAIWEPYYRGMRGPNAVKGSGLGLAVVKLLASSVGWEVGVRDSAGGGPAFYLRLPGRSAATLNSLPVAR